MATESIHQQHLLSQSRQNSKRDELIKLKSNINEYK